MKRVRFVFSILIAATLLSACTKNSGSSTTAVVTPYKTITSSELPDFVNCKELNDLNPYELILTIRDSKSSNLPASMILIKNGTNVFNVMAQISIGEKNVFNFKDISNGNKEVNLDAHTKTVKLIHTGIPTLKDGTVLNCML